MAIADPSPIVGVQRPRICWIPPHASSTGVEAVELCRMAGLSLDPWEELILANGLNEREDGRWAAFEVGMTVERQNGKGAILEGRELAGLFLLGEELLTHTAHQFKTSKEAFRRLLIRIENTPEFSRRVVRVSKTHGEEGIELRNPRTGLRQRVMFQTRTKGAGIGFTGDLLVFDEDMFLDENEHGALLPTLSARPNPQVWYAGTAVDRQRHPGKVKARIRQRGIRGGDDALMYVEFSPDLAARLEERGEDFDPLDIGPDDVDDAWAGDPATWAQGNPGLGIRISLEHVAREKQSMHPRTFAVERLGVGDWPRVDDTGIGDRVIPTEAWERLADPRSKALDPVCLAFDVRSDRTAAAIGACGARRDGRPHVETVDHKPGVRWVVPRLVELVGRHKPVGVLCHANSPAAALVAPLKRLGVDVKVIGTPEFAQACGYFFDEVIEERRLRHLGTSELTWAVDGARKRAVGEAWAWSRTASMGDASPLVTITLALWGWANRVEVPALDVSDYRILSLEE